MSKLQHMFNDSESNCNEIAHDEQKELDMNTDSFDRDCVQGSTMFDCKNCSSFETCKAEFNNETLKQLLKKRIEFETSEGLGKLVNDIHINENPISVNLAIVLDKLKEMKSDESVSKSDVISTIYAMIEIILQEDIEKKERTFNRK